MRGYVYVLTLSDGSPIRLETGDETILFVALGGRPEVFNLVRALVGEVVADRTWDSLTAHLRDDHGVTLTREPYVPILCTR